ncbi:MAG: methylenetetrahydrofolate reductase [NAD(P)H] [Candidatus Margulisiibacteriota bacterium]
MKVIESLGEGQPTLSFEFFPPKTKEQEEQLFQVIESLLKFYPNFASVTCGALGTNKDKTLYWAKQLQERFQIEPLAHMTCVAATKKEILQQLEEMKALEEMNILALRGDPPAGDEKYTPPENGFLNAKELVAYIKSRRMDFCVGVAGYPEGHRESPSLEADIQYLKEKVDAGADYIISQLFFDNRYFFDFLDRCKKAGIKVPIIPGIMPITSFSQVKKITEICGATIPPKLLDKLERFSGDNEAVAQLGIKQAVAQCQELLEADVPGLHFFVMNKSGPISIVLKNLTPINK